MVIEVHTLDRDVAGRVLAATVAGPLPDRAAVLFPAVLGDTARVLAGALEHMGVSCRVDLINDESFQHRAPSDAAQGWVPSLDGEPPPLLVLFAAQPWADPFDGDHLIELAAMENREALLAAGHRLVFVEWPRGARLDEEVDLRSQHMAEIFSRGLDIDYDALRIRNGELLAQVGQASEVAITCPSGTDVRLSVAGRRWIAEDCCLGSDEPAIYLPGGEVYVAAREDSAEGAVHFRFCGAPRVALFRAGMLVAVERADGSQDEDLEEELGAGVEPLCEVGIGTNPWAPPWQIGTLYEKSMGTAHVAVGGNAHFGGQRHSPRHGDLIIRDAQVRVDGVPLPLASGKWSTWSHLLRAGD